MNCCIDCKYFKSTPWAAVTGKCIRDEGRPVWLPCPSEHKCDKFEATKTEVKS